jgi:hypothetical protein
MRRRLVFIGALIVAIVSCLGKFAHRAWLHVGVRPSTRIAMNRKNWLDGYSGETTRQLIGLENEYRVDSIVLAFEQAIGQKAAREGESKLTGDERIVLAIEALEREVNNGGYSQFFVNSLREYTPIIVDSLQRIGCPRAAEITQEAVSALRLIDPSTAQIESEMEKESEERDAVLERCNKRYFKESEAIADQLFAYIKIHQESFRLWPCVHSLVCLCNRLVGSLGKVTCIISS